MTDWEEEDITDKLSDQQRDEDVERGEESSDAVGERTPLNDVSRTMPCEESPHGMVGETPSIHDVAGESTNGGVCGTQPFSNEAGICLIRRALQHSHFQRSKYFKNIPINHGKNSYKFNSILYIVVFMTSLSHKVISCERYTNHHKYSQKYW